MPWAGLLSAIWSAFGDSVKVGLLSAAGGAMLASYLVAGHYQGRMAADEAARQWAVAKALKAQADDRARFEQRLSAAIASRDEALSALDRERAAGAAGLERLRKQLRARPLSGGEAGACKPTAAALARCERLLGEGVELLEEGRDLLKRHGADHDALTKIR